MRMILAFLIAKALPQSAGSLWAIRDILLVFTGKATLNVSTHFPKYNAHRLDTGADHAWIDDTDLYTWIPFFRIGGLSVPMVWMLVLITLLSCNDRGLYMLSSALEALPLSCFTGLLQYATTGVHGAGTIDRSDSFLTLRAGRAKFVGK